MIPFNYDVYWLVRRASCSFLRIAMSPTHWQHTRLVFPGDIDASGAAFLGSITNQPSTDTEPMVKLLGTLSVLAGSSMS